MTNISMWLEFVLNVVKYSVNQTAIFYPFLIVIALCVLASIAFLIKYVCKSTM